MKNSLCLFTRKIDGLDVQTINYTNNIGILDYRFSIDVINSSLNKRILFLEEKYLTALIFKFRSRYMDI